MRIKALSIGSINNKQTARRIKNFRTGGSHCYSVAHMQAKDAGGQSGICAPKFRTFVLFGRRKRSRRGREEGGEEVEKKTNRSPGKIACKTTIHSLLCSGSLLTQDANNYSGFILLRNKKICTASFGHCTSVLGVQCNGSSCLLVFPLTVLGAMVY